MPREANDDFKWLLLIHPDDQGTTLAAWQAAIDTGSVFEHDYRIRRFDGEFRWHRCRALPVRGTSDEIVKWIGTASDIHDQLRLEAELRQVRIALEQERG